MFTCKIFKVQPDLTALLFSLVFSLCGTTYCKQEEEMPLIAIQVENTQSNLEHNLPDKPAIEEPKSAFGEFIEFLKAFAKNRAATGAIAPSSPFLARSITDCIDKEKPCKRILEIGAGTGVFTLEIIKKLNADDHLDVIEFSEELCAILSKKFGHIKNVHIHCLSILDWQDTTGYDYIVSGLPLNAFESKFVEEVLAIYKKMLKSDGHIAYFEYVALGTIKHNFLRITDREAADDFNKVLTMKETFKYQFTNVEESVVPINLPPARVVHCTNELEDA